MALQEFFNLYHFYKSLINVISVFILKIQLVTGHVIEIIVPVKIIVIMIISD